MLFFLAVFRHHSRYEQLLGLLSTVVRKCWSFLSIYSTAAMGRHALDFSDDEFDFDEYFASTYRPLSNLPTPPLSSKNSSTSQSPRSLGDDGEPLESTLLGMYVSFIDPIGIIANPCHYLQDLPFTLSICCLLGHP